MKQHYLNEEDPSNTVLLIMMDLSMHEKCNEMKAELDQELNTTTSSSSTNKAVPT
ncbi:hypothetical protein C1646_753544 [Rhizophagus diaphanus]|nr:hypothetical protein C1646_753544 [Rhizophagus diaphanus] [Rhizophagus sp. MUCL 43196]